LVAESLQIMTTKQTPSIVDAIKLYSISALTPLLDKYPELKTVINESKSDRPIDDWDFFMTAAGSGLVLISTETYKGEHDEVRNRAREINIDLPRAIDDFIAFWSQGDRSDEMVAPTIGMWVLWNVKQEAPDHDEIKELAPGIGFLLLKIVIEWRKHQH
jgi:hypothetical protein